MKRRLEATGTTLTVKTLECTTVDVESRHLLNVAHGMTADGVVGSFVEKGESGSVVDRLGSGEGVQSDSFVGAVQTHVDGTKPGCCGDAESG